MSGSSNSDPPVDLAADELQLARHAQVLADGIVQAMPGWVERVVARVADAWEPGLSAALVPQARAAGQRAAAEVGPVVRDLLALDVDLQPTGPLAVVRTAVAHPTAVLADAGVPDVERDPFAVRAFPDDRYGLAPASFSDLDDSLHEPGLVWGAAKAHVILARRRSAGQR